MIGTRWARAAAWTTVLMLMASSASAQIGRHFFNRGGPAPAGSVNLPYAFNDNNGNIWRIYNGGWMQQQGNPQVYSQGAMLTVNGAQVNQPNNQARLDDNTGEITLEDLQAPNLAITRHILFDKDQGLLRYIDVFKNTAGQDQTVAVMIQSNLNFGINVMQFVADPKKKDQNYAWVGQSAIGQSVVEMYAGKGAKLAPTLVSPQGNSYVQANFSLTLPAGKEMALMHLHRMVATQDQGVQFAASLKESQLMKGLPAALRKIIVNFPNSQGWIGNMEVLRGDLLDVVELRGGDQIRGTLKEPNYTLQTYYGPVVLSADNVIGIVNVGQFRPTQLIVTSDGQIFGGTLKKQTVDLVLSSGQLTPIPLAQVTRVGYRKRAGEPEEWTFDRPLLFTRTGERMAIKPLQAPLQVATRYGTLTLKPEDIAAVLFQSDETSVHQILLNDGSKFSGIVAANDFDVVLETGDQAVKCPTSSIVRLQLAPKLPEADDLAPTIRLLNDDLLVGTLQGKLNLDTAFDTIAINAGEIRSLARAPDSVGDVQVVLWDGTSLSGELHESVLDCELKCGVSMKVPVALLDRYNQPQPAPSASMLEKIKGLIADLNADDWKQRDRAQATLIEMGTVAEAPLKELRAKQSAEAQKGIDMVLQKLEEQRKKEKKEVHAAGTGDPPRMEINVQAINN